MSRRTTKAVAVMAAALMMTAACSPSGESVEDDPVTTVFGTDPQTVLDLETNWFTQFANEEFGLEFEFDTAPWVDAMAKQSLLLASGNYPDVIWSGELNAVEVLTYGQQGIFVPLNDLLQEHAPNAWEAIQSVPGYADSVTAPDGNIYALPGYNYCFHCFWTNRMWINSRHLDAFGLEMPRTTSEFQDMLEVFQANGLDALTGALNGYANDPSVFLMNAFVPFNGPDAGAAAGYVNVVDGNVSFAPVQEEWRDGLAYMHDLYRAGLLTKDDLTQDPDAAKQLVTEALTGAFAGAGPNSMTNNYGDPDGNGLDWLPVPPLTNDSGGGGYAPFRAGGFANFRFAITDRASDQDIEKILSLVDFMYTTEGQQIQNFGPEGEFWTHAEEGQQGLVPEQALFVTDWTAFYSGDSTQNSGWNQWGPIYQSEEWRNLNFAAPPFDPDGAATLLHLAAQLEYAGKQPDQVYPAVAWIDPSIAQSFSTQQVNINNFVESWKAQFITGDRSVENDWQEYLDGLANLGLDEYLERLQEGMTAPFDTTGETYQSSERDIEYLLGLGEVPELTQKYLIQAGIPESYFD